MELEKSCGAVIVKAADTPQFLLVLQNDGHWGFPKGHVEGAETETETAMREIREETGLEVTIDDRFRTVDNYSPKPGVTKDVVYFLATPMAGRLTPQLSEISCARWCTFAEAERMFNFESNRKILSAAMEFLSNPVSGGNRRKL